MKKRLDQALFWSLLRDGIQQRELARGKAVQLESNTYGANSQL
jgi:hypothetical protein